MSKKLWDDQPDCVLNAETLCNIYLGSRNGHQVDIRIDNNPHLFSYEKPLFLTAGNLFGSQTFLCKDFVCLLKFLNTVAALNDGQELKSLPAGVTVLPNKDETPKPEKFELDNDELL